MLDKELNLLIKDAKKLANEFEVKLQYNDEFKVDEKDEFVLDSININAAFFPSVWFCLTLTQKLAAVIAASRWHKINLKKFCFDSKHYYEICVFDGKNLCFNISALNNVLFDSVEFLTEILNYSNQKKYFKYKIASKEKTRILDFSSFEELQYSINMKITDDENANDLTRAIYLDQKPFRDYRNAKLLALNCVLDYSTSINAEDIKENYKEQINKILGDIEFINSVLGEDLLVRNLEFLRVVNNILLKEENLQLADAVKHFEKHFGNMIVSFVENNELK